MIHASDKDTADPVEDLDDLYENAPCGFLSMRADGRIVKSNATLSGWIGIPAQDLIGKRLRDLLTVAGRIFYETNLAPLLQVKGAFNEITLDLVTADGATFPVLANALVKRDSGGELLFTRVTIFPGAQRRLYERDLVEARDAAAAAGADMLKTLEDEREVAELREQFIAVLGHDLRNPLAALSGGTQILLFKEHDEKRRTVLTMMAASVKRMSDLIDNVLDFARGRLGDGITLQKERLPLEPTLRQVIDEIRAAWPDRVIETRFDLDRPANVDHARISQLFSNLLGNAITHGAADQPIRIEAACTEQGVTLAVANGGEAIPAAVLPHLFHPFSRGKVRSSLQGLGLGLFIASQIAASHGGTLTVASDASETRFTLEIPEHLDLG